jgi:tetratricopeptide (TPR) repeat protein
MVLNVASMLLLLAATPGGARVSSAPADSARYSNPEGLRHYMQGRLFEERGEVESATNEYYRALGSDPALGAAARRISELAARSGDAARSLEFARRALAVDSTDSRALWLMGVAQFEQGQRPQGLHSLEAAVSIDSVRTEYLQTLAHMAQETEDFALEERTLQRLVAVSDDDGEAWFQLAALAARDGRFAQADSALTRSQGINPDRPGGDFLGAWIAESEGRDSLAIVRFRRHLAAHDSDQTTRRRLVTLLARSGNFDEAYTESRIVSKSREGDPDAQIVEADLAFRAGAPAAGESLIRRMAGEHADDPELLTRAIGVLARHGRPRQADTLAVRWAAAHPGDFRGAMMRARVSLLGGENAAAIDQAEAAVALAPDSLETHALLGRMLQGRQRWSEAESLWVALMRRFPGYSVAPLELAFCREQLGDIAGAERAVRELLKHDPENSEALNTLGYLLADHNRDLDEAERLIRRAVAQQPDNGAFLDSLGWLFFRRGRLADARVQLERAANLTGDDPVIREHLGDVYKGLKINDLAREQYRRSLRQDSTNTRVRGKLEQER